MSRWIGRRAGLLAALVGIPLGVGVVRPAIGQPASPVTSSPGLRATEQFRAAAALQDRELFDLAAAEYATLIDEFPADPLADRARLERGVCLFQLARYEDARAEFRQLLSQPAKLKPELREQCYAHLGLAEYNLGHAADSAERAQALDAAIATLSKQLELFPAGPLAAQAAFYRAEALYARGRLDAAIAAYRALLDQYPDHPQRADALYALGVAQQERGRFADAAHTFEQFRGEFPQHPSAADAQLRQGDALLALGVQHLELGRVNDAADALADAAALPRWPKSDAVLLALAEAQHGQGKTADAIRSIDRLVAEFPDGAEFERAYLHRGQYHAALKNWPVAVADFNELVERWPASVLVPQALVARARAQVGQSDLTAAEASLSQCLEQYPAHELATEARLLRATVRHERGDFTGGVADADAILAADPPRPQRSNALHIRGLCELGLGKPAAAAQTLARIVESDPQCRTMDRVLYDLAWAYRESHDPERATATFAKLAESYPASPLAAECHYRVGESRYASGDFAKSAESYAAAAKLTTDVALGERSLHKLAWSHFEQKDYHRAVDAFDDQIAKHPGGFLVADARIMAAECRFQRHEFGEVLAAFVAAVDQRAASESLRAMALVHAGQTAAQLDDWPRSLELLDRSLREFPNSQWATEARCERGTALYELGRLDEAQQEFAAVAAKNSGLLGIRAEFMLGEILFAKEQHDDAVRMYFKAAYGHGDRDAPEAYHRWQAEAIYGAARSLEQTKRPDSARQLYQELLTRFPASEKASAARQSLEQNIRR